MIITRTPLRISFVGGGSDLPAFYQQTPGRVISTAINKYVFVTVNEKFDRKFRIGYSVTEIVDRPEKIQNTRVRAALQHFGVTQGLEIVSVADVPSHGTGLGSSSSFLVGLTASLSQLLGHHVHKDRKALAELASHLEIDVLKEPIGKQDQYAAAYGGLNEIEFHPDGVTVTPLRVSPDVVREFRDHLLVFYTGITRSATAVLKTVRHNFLHDEKVFLCQQKLVDLVKPFRTKLQRGDFQALGDLLHEGWLLKQQTSPVIANDTITKLYQLGRKNGAWGGKLLGAGGGGFLLFLAHPKHHHRLRTTFRKLPELSFGFDDHGAKVIFNRYEYQ